MDKASLRDGQADPTLIFSSSRCTHSQANIQAAEPPKHLSALPASELDPQHSSGHATPPSRGPSRPRTHTPDEATDGSGLLVEPDPYHPPGAAEEATPPATPAGQDAAAREAEGAAAGTAAINTELISDDDHPPPSQPTSVVTFGRDPDDCSDAAEGTPEADADSLYNDNHSMECSGDSWSDDEGTPGPLGEPGIDESEDGEGGEVAQVLYVTAGEMGDAVAAGNARDVVMQERNAYASDSGEQREERYFSEDDHPPPVA